VNIDKAEEQQKNYSSCFKTIGSIKTISGQLFSVKAVADAVDCEGDSR